MMIHATVVHAAHLFDTTKLLYLGSSCIYPREVSHVLPALMRKFREAKANGEASVEVWGTGSPMREFLHVDDLADICLHLMDNYELHLMDNYEDAEHINAGTGEDITIKHLAETIRDIVYPEGEIHWDTSKRAA